MSKTLKPPASFIRKSQKDVASAVRLYDDTARKSVRERFGPASEMAIVFARRFQLVVYGDMAIDALLPDDKKLHDRMTVDIFSATPKEHACQLADELDDALGKTRGIDFFVRQSVCSDDVYHVVAGNISVADFALMSSEQLDRLHRLTDRHNRPYAPVDFLFYRMHVEFAQGSPMQWVKTLQQYGNMLDAYPIQHDPACVSKLFIEKPENDVSLALEAALKSLRRYKDCGPLVGAYAALFMCGKIGKVLQTIPSCGNLSAVEVLSARPEEEANRLLGTLSKFPLTLSQPLQIMAGFSEVVVLFKKVKLVTFIRCDRTCEARVYGGLRNEISLGSIDTVLGNLYARLLFGEEDATMSESLRCLIGCLYEAQFNTAEQKRTKVMRRFTVGECYGPGPGLLKRRSTPPFVYKAFLPDAREARRATMMAEKQQTRKWGLRPPTSQLR